jgi:hypothetical protein
MDEKFSKDIESLKRNRNFVNEKLKSKKTTVENITNTLYQQKNHTRD